MVISPEPESNVLTNFSFTPIASVSTDMHLSIVPALIAAAVVESFNVFSSRAKFRVYVMSDEPKVLALFLSNEQSFSGLSLRERAFIRLQTSI